LGEIDKARVKFKFQEYDGTEADLYLHHSPDEEARAVTPQMAELYERTATIYRYVIGRVKDYLSQNGVLTGEAESLLSGIIYKLNEDTLHEPWFPDTPDDFLSSAGTPDRFLPYISDEFPFRDIVGEWNDPRFEVDVPEVPNESETQKSVELTEKFGRSLRAFLKKEYGLPIRGRYSMYDKFDQGFSSKIRGQACNVRLFIQRVGDKTWIHAIFGIEGKVVVDLIIDPENPDAVKKMVDLIVAEAGLKKVK